MQSGFVVRSDRFRQEIAADPWQPDLPAVRVAGEGDRHAPRLEAIDKLRIVGEKENIFSSRNIREDTFEVDFAGEEIIRAADMNRLLPATDRNDAIFHHGDSSVLHRLANPGVTVPEFMVSEHGINSERSAELLQKRGKFRFRKIASGPSGAVDEVAEKEDQIRRFGIDRSNDALKMRSAPGGAEVQIAQRDDFHSVETPRPSGDLRFDAAKGQPIWFDEERPQQTAADQKNQDGDDGGRFVFPWNFHAKKYTRKRNFQIFWHAFCYSIPKNIV